jgi:hypothetical protein
MEGKGREGNRKEWNGKEGIFRHNHLHVFVLKYS